MPAPIWLFMLPGVVILLFSIPLILRRVPPNPLYGLRVPATYKDEQVWYDANAASGRDLAIFGTGVTLLAVVLRVAGVRDMAFAIAWSAALGAGAICTGVLGWVRANRMFRERQTRAR
jgi:uncharacterized membrane protein